MHITCSMYAVYHHIANRQYITKTSSCGLNIKPYLEIMQDKTTEIKIRHSFRNSLCASRTCQSACPSHSPTCHIIFHFSILFVCALPRFATNNHYYNSIFKLLLLPFRCTFAVGLHFDTIWLRVCHRHVASFPITCTIRSSGSSLCLHLHNNKNDQEQKKHPHSTQTRTNRKMF